MVDIISTLSTNWTTAVGLLGIGLVAYWYFDERDSPEDTVLAVGKRADSAFGRALGAFGSILVVTLSITLTIGDQIIDLVSALLMFNADPLVLSNVAAAIIGMLGLSGTISVGAMSYGLLAVIVMIIALAWRRA